EPRVPVPALEEAHPDERDQPPVPPGLRQAVERARLPGRDDPDWRVGDGDAGGGRGTHAETPPGAAMWSRFAMFKPCPRPAQWFRACGSIASSVPGAPAGFRLN